MEEVKLWFLPQNVSIYTDSNSVFENRQTEIAANLDLKTRLSDDRHSVLSMTLALHNYHDTNNSLFECHGQQNHQSQIETFCWC